MNDDNNNLRDDATGDPLRWQLRALRRDQAPERDLWPGIEAALVRPPVAPRRNRFALPVALAASLLAVVGVAGWWQAGEPVSVQVARPDAALPATLVEREVAGMTRQYDAALMELGTARVAPDGNHAYSAALDELDRSAGLILDALAHDPDSRLLLQQLRRTYTQRLALAQRAALS